jgi:guanylate kinase
MAGKLIIFSAPSGAGKTTIVRYLLSQEARLEFSISACSRMPRANEKHGVDYYFFTEQEFRENIEAGRFVEWEEVYPGNFYGTLHSEIERIHSKGHHVLFDIDVVGGMNLKKLFGSQALSVFILPPSVDILAERLRSRGSDSEETIRQRVDKAEWEMQFAGDFDRQIFNAEILQAREEALILVREFMQS